MNVEEKLKLISEVGEETIGLEEIKIKLEKRQQLIAYDGFEPSGKIHIAQGLMKAINVNKMTKAGCEFIFWVADYFAQLNNKYDGDLEKIQVVGKYFIEVWKSCGMNLDNVKFIWTSEALDKSPKYWKDFLKLSTIPSVNRVLKCGQIMGREDSGKNPTSQIVYPLLQANDIHFLKADICQLGLDQRKVNMLARDIFDKMGWEKPAIVSSHMLLGLQKLESGKKKIEYRSYDFSKEYDTLIENKIKFHFKFEDEKVVLILGEKKIVLEINKIIKYDNMNLKLLSIREKENEKIGVDIEIEILKNEIDRKIEMKMSKSKPNTAIFMTDTNQEVEKKFKKAHCIDTIVEDNPILEYFKYIIFEKYLSGIEFERPEKFGGMYKVKNYETLEVDFKNSLIGSFDLKMMCAKYINELLEPTRKHFKENDVAKNLLEKVESYVVSR